MRETDDKNISYIFFFFAQNKTIPTQLCSIYKLLLDFAIYDIFAVPIFYVYYAISSKRQIQILKAIWGWSQLFAVICKHKRKTHQSYHVTSKTRNTIYRSACETHINHHTKKGEIKWISLEEESCTVMCYKYFYVRLDCSDLILTLFKGHKIALYGISPFYFTKTLIVSTIW